MTLEDLKEADNKTQFDIGLKIYTNLVKLYLDQMGEDNNNVIVIPAKTM